MPTHQSHLNQSASAAVQAARRPAKPYLVLSTTGFVEVSVRDPFSERMVQLHYEHVVLTLADPSYGGLCEFAGTEIDGRELLADPTLLLDALRKGGVRV